MFGPVMPMGCFLRPTESDEEKKYGQSFLSGAAIPCASGANFAALPLSTHVSRDVRAKNESTTKLLFALLAHGILSDAFSLKRFHCMGNENRIHNIK